MKRICLLIYIFPLIFLSCSPESEQSSPMPENAIESLPTITLNINGVEVKAEVAVSFAAQSRGLMFRESMPENHGMLFVYSQPKYMSFWMKNTTIPLSIAFIREDGVIGNIEKMQPQQGNITPTKHYQSKYKSLYALEMNQGWFEQNGVKAGDKIKIPTEPIQMLMNPR